MKPRDSVPGAARPVAVLTGPTGTGKTDVALALAGEFPLEIVSVDSAQVYRGLDIGTAKPSAAEQARVTHHLIDVAALHEPFDAARFCVLAKQAVAAIQRRGRTPIFCGGTGLYFKAYLEGLGEAPPSDPELRARLEATPLADLLAELMELDPVTYEKIDRQNPRRVIRAVEVIRLTGEPFSAQRSRWGATFGGPFRDEASRARSTHPSGQTDRFFVLTRAKPDLDARINDRVDAMFDRGLVAETRGVLEQGLERNPTAMQAIGYRQVVEHLQGKRALDETVALVKGRTRQFAKRQLTWFRRQMAAQWLELQPDQPGETVADRILAGFPP